MQLPIPKVLGFAGETGFAARGKDMTAISWKEPISGNWSDASDWSTDTVPTSADDVTIPGDSPYSVAVDGADTANSLTLSNPLAALVENTGSLTIAGALTVNSGLASLNEANTIGSVAISGGVVAFSDDGALGTGVVSMTGGELVSTQSRTLSNALQISGTSTIAAENGTALTEDASTYALSAGTVLNIGTAAQRGPVYWATNDTSASNFSASYSVHVRGAELVADDAHLSLLLGNAAQTTVEAGASIDVNGFDTTISNLLGAGAIIDSGPAATLTLAEQPTSWARSPLRCRSLRTAR